MKISDQFEQYVIEKEKRDKYDKLYRKLMGFSKRQFNDHYFRGEAGGIPPSGDDYDDFVTRAFMYYLPSNRKYFIDTEIISKYHVEKQDLNWNQVSRIFIKQNWAEEINRSQIRLNENWRDHIPSMRKLFRKSEFDRLNTVMLKANKIFISELYNFIRRKISDESKLKINNQIKNETYYEDCGFYNNPLTVTDDERLNISEELVEADLKEIRVNTVREFIEKIDDPELKKCIEVLSANNIGLKELIDKFTQNSSKLMRELIAKGWVYDNSGQRTNKIKKINRPCKIRIDYKFKNNKERKYLFGILKTTYLFEKPQLAALYLEIPNEKYCSLIRQIRRKFIEHICTINDLNTKALFKETGIFQEAKYKKEHKNID